MPCGGLKLLCLDLLCLAVVGQQLTGRGKHLLWDYAPGHKPDAFTQEAFIWAAVVEDEDGDAGHARLEFRDEIEADPGALTSGDDESQFSGELGLLNQTQRFCGVTHPLHIGELPLQDGLSH